MLATISLRSSGSQAITVSARASATTAVIEAALADIECRWSSSVIIKISNWPSSPSVPGRQLALRIFTRRVCSLAPGMHPVSQTSTWHVEQNPGTAPKERHNNASYAANATPRLAAPTSFVLALRAAGTAR